MVSIAIVVLPMARSPMINSRWPRPRANRVSTTTRPVWTGSVTRSRSMIAGAARSTGCEDSAGTGPLPSSGRPSGSTIRPSSPGPTGTRTTSPVPRTASPASTPSTSSNRTQPIRSRSSTWAKPNWPLSNRSSSSSRTRASPETRATPSPTDSTRPIASATGPKAAAPSLTRACSNHESARPSGAAVMAEFRQNSAEIGPPAIGHGQMRPVQFEPGDERRIGRELDPGRGTEGGTDRLPALLLFGRRERGGADRCQGDAIGCSVVPDGLGQGADRGDQPVEEGLAHLRAGQAFGQAPGDVDREPVRPHPPFLFGGLLLLGECRLGRGAERSSRPGG